MGFNGVKINKACFRDADQCDWSIHFADMPAGTQRLKKKKKKKKKKRKKEKERGSFVAFLLC